MKTSPAQGTRRRRWWTPVSVGTLAWLVACAAPKASQPTVWRANPGRLTLIDAVKAGEREAANALIAAHADVRATEADGTTALHWAVHNADADLVDRLIGAGADVKARNQYGVVPLAEAAIEGKTAIIQRLLNAGADVESANDAGQTALMAVSRTDNVASVKLLLDRGANVNAREQWRGQTALMWAAAERLPQVVLALVERGAQVNARSFIVEWEREVTAEPRRKFVTLGGLTPLLFTAREGCLECARILVDKGADVNLQDPFLVSPTIMAVANGHYDIATLLVERGADVNLSDRWGRNTLYTVVDMHTAPRSARPNVTEDDPVATGRLLRLVLERGADVDAALTLFAPYRSATGDRGADRFVLTIGATPLIRASKAVDVEAVRLLLARGANPNIATNNGVTPLMAAAGVGHMPNKDSRGKYREQRDAVECARLLLDAGANVNAAEVLGQTALHGAARWGWSSLVQLLADRGAKVDAKDHYGRTPADAAINRAGPGCFAEVQTYDCTDYDPNRLDIYDETASLLRRLGGGPTPTGSAAPPARRADGHGAR